MSAKSPKNQSETVLPSTEVSTTEAAQVNAVKSSSQAVKTASELPGSMITHSSLENRTISMPFIDFGSSIANAISALTTINQASLGNIQTGMLSNKILSGNLANSMTTASMKITNPFQELLSEESRNKIVSLENNRQELKNKLNTAYEELATEKISSEQYKSKVIELESYVQELKKIHDIDFLLKSVSENSHNALLSNDELRNRFFSQDVTTLYAVSIDIRRSTELMLKARTPQYFAEFITTLCFDLMKIVKNHFGVIDKFTGDGILCFFPDFFAGPDAGYYALSAATECHSLFTSHYRRSRSYFKSIPAETGLGIGIDYGPCHLVQVAGSLTIVGEPVVYACRFGGAPAGVTLLNQPAYEMLSDKYGSQLMFSEQLFPVKHEGVFVAYSATLSNSKYSPINPTWISSE